MPDRRNCRAGCQAVQELGAAAIQQYMNHQEPSVNPKATVLDIQLAEACFKFTSGFAASRKR